MNCITWLCHVIHFTWLYHAYTHIKLHTMLLWKNFANQNQRWAKISRFKWAQSRRRFAVNSGTAHRSKRSLYKSKGDLLDAAQLNYDASVRINCSYIIDSIRWNNEQLKVSARSYRLGTFKREPNVSLMSYAN